MSLSDAPSAYEQIQEARLFIAGQLQPGQIPELGIVLGSGLGLLTERLEDTTTVPYSSIPNMPSAGVAGHSGQLLIGKLGGKTVVCLSGRCHLYEGHAPERVVFGVRLLAALGISTVIVTNASGGIHSSCVPGSLMMITDHINLTGSNPLVGPNHDRWGPRFPDMSEPYDALLTAEALTIAAEQNIPVHCGTYAGVLGPSYETKAEVKMLETLGASAVGMSTVFEVIALRHQGVRVVGICCITNHATGKASTPLNHDDVKRVAQEASNSFCSLVESLCTRIEASHQAK